MAPFERAESVLSGFKDRVDSVAVQGDRLYLGTSIGNLHVYSFKDDAGPAEEVVVKKGLARRSIEQLGYVKDINSLVVLAEKQVTLYPLQDLSPPTVLSKAKAAFSFAVHTSVQHLLPDGQPVQTSSVGFDRTTAVPTVITYLLVGCQRKLVIYSWKDGEAQDVKEAVLPHSPRTMAFLNNDIVCLAYQPDFVLFSLRTHSITEVTTPVPPALSAQGISSMGKGALSGLGGYMTLGLGAKAKPCVVNVGDSEALIAKENFGVFIGPDGKQSRTPQVEWPATPEDLAFVKPYIFTLLPAGTVPTASITNSISSTSTIPFSPSPVLQIRSSISLQPSQTLSFPFDPSTSSSSEATTPSTTTHTLRLLTASPNAKSPLFVISTPVDRAMAASEGSSMWKFKMKGWGGQVDELVADGSYDEAIKLLDTIDEAVLPDKDRRKSLCQALHAVSQFSSAHFDEALDTFVTLNINPAKVIALYPSSVSGRLSVPQQEWIPLFGGPKSKPKRKSASASVSASSDHQTDEAKRSSIFEEGQGQEDEDGASTEESGPSRGRSPPPGGTAPASRSRWKPALDVFRPGGGRDSETASISSVKQRRPNDTFTRSVESLLRYLPDRRIKLATSLEAFHITSLQAHEHKTLLSSTPLVELFTIPSYAPLSNLTPQQLVQCAQVVDTALFKAYMVIRPGLIGSLCRQPNWCEVEEVEEILMSKEKYTELIALYNGKKMHSKALDLLHTLSEKETDMRDKLEPSIIYLQRLGPEHLDQIFKSSRWLFDKDADMAFEIFTSEEVELPRDPVIAYLEGIDSRLGAQYLEYLMQERKEESTHNGDRLAELYLKMTKDAKRKRDEETRKQVYDKFLDFIDKSQHYQVDRLFGHLPAEDFFEAKAILLGRLNRHDSALEIYVYRLHDYVKAEEYCKRVYVPTSSTSSIFLTLLRIYLRPSPSYQPSHTPQDKDNTLLRPALDLISRHSRRIDAEEALQLLPPLVSAQDLRAFLIEALREPVFDTMVVRDISKARSEQVARRLMWLQSNRVKVTDSRICPQCHKRIGHSSIAVHTPGGEVTHYHCREAFSRKLKEMRHT